MYIGIGFLIGDLIDLAPSNLESLGCIYFNVLGKRTLVVTKIIYAVQSLGSGSSNRLCMC